MASREARTKSPREAGNPADLYQSVHFLLDGERWVDHWGESRRLQDMDRGHLLGVLRLLRYNAPLLYHSFTAGDIFRRDYRLVLPRVWLDNTPLVAAIRGMLGLEAITPAEEMLDEFRVVRAKWRRYCPDSGYPEPEEEPGEWGMWLPGRRVDVIGDSAAELTKVAPRAEMFSANR